MAKVKPLWEETNYRPWGLQEQLKQQPILTEQDVKIITINNFMNAGQYKETRLRNRALFILTYLTAGRISEVLNLRKTDLCGEYRQDRKILLIRMINRKNRNKRFKELPLPVDKEGILLDLLNEYLKILKGNDLLFESSWKVGECISRLHAYRILRRYTGFNCHWLRHLRLTHLVVNHDFNEQLLIRFAGWTNSLPAKHYMELRWEDFLDKY